MKFGIFFLGEKVLSKALIVQHVPSFDMFADFLAKPLSPLIFLQLRDKLHIYDKVTLAQR